MQDSSTSGAEPLISLTGVSKRFPNGTLALDNVDLNIPRGQLLSLIGLSGSGKSTLMRHLNGLHRPTSGVVKVMGVEVSSASNRQLRGVRKNIGFVFQQFGLVGRATCLENVLTGALGRLNGPRYGVWSYPKHLRSEAFDHLERVGLVNQAYQRADTLSGGEAQRIKLARELARPATGDTLYLLDEPSTGLHFDDIRKLLVVVQRLVDLGNTVVMIEHNLDIVKTADWVIDMGPEGGTGGGQVVAVGTPEKVAKVKASHTGRFLKELLR